MPDDILQSAPGGTGDAAPSGDAAAATTPSPAPDDRKELLDRLAQMGRERAEAQRQAEELRNGLQQTNGALYQTQQQLDYIQRSMGKARWDEWEARMQRLEQTDPTAAANERARVSMQYAQHLEQRLQQATQPRQQPNQAPRESDEQYSRRVATAMLDKVNQRYRLEGMDALTLRDLPAEAWSSQEDFMAEAAVMARDRANKSAGDTPVASKKDESVEAIVAREVAKAVGAGRSLSPSPSAGADNEPVTPEVSDIVMRNAGEGGARSRPGQSIAELQKFKSQYAAKLNRR